MADTVITQDAPVEQAVDVQGAIENPEAVKELSTPDEIAAWVISLIYDFDNTHMLDTIQRAEKAYGYYNGHGQWDPDIAAKLKAEKRPCLTFNEIRPKIDAIIGEERRNREDWVAHPTEQSDDAEAEVRTALLKHVRDTNDLEEDESRTFEEVVIGGYGGMAASLQTINEGDPPLLRLQHRSWKELKWDWNSKRRDMTDGQWVAVTFLAPVDKLKETFPQWKDEISEEWLGLLTDPLIPPQPEVGERPGVTRYLDGNMRPMLFRAEERMVRVTEFHYRTTRKRAFLTLVTPQGVQEKEIDDGAASLATAKQIHDERRGVLRQKSVPGIRTILVVGRRTLANWWAPFRGTNAFGDPYFPVFIVKASDTNGYIMGLVEPATAPQDEVNKRWSMMVENYAKQARSGGLIEESATDDVKKFEREYGTPGKWQVVKNQVLSAGKIKAHTPPPTDMALMQLFQWAERVADRVTNIDLARMGLKSNETSGLAIRTRAMQSALVQVKAFDNFRHFQLLIGKFVNANLGLMFPVKKTLRLQMPNSGGSQVVTLNDRKIMQGAIRIVNSTQGEQFDITMDLTPSNATFREFTAQNTANLLGQIGPAMQSNPLLVAPYITLLLSLIQMMENVPGKDEIVQQLRQAVAKVSAPHGPPPPPPPEPPRVSINLKGELSPQDARAAADGRVDQTQTPPPVPGIPGPGAPMPPLPPGRPGPVETPPPAGPPAPVAASPPEPPSHLFVPAAAQPRPPGPPQPVTAAGLATPDLQRMALIHAIMRGRAIGGR